MATIVPIPSTLKPAEGQYLLLVTPGYWSRGTTMAETKANLKSNGGSLRSAWQVYTVDKSTYVDDMGTIVRDMGTPAPVMLAASNQ